MQIDNATFLRAIFGGQARRAHVTSFDEDPATIPSDRRGLAWGGHSYMARPLKGMNQYFTISLFSLDDEGKSRRRKNLFEATYCIVLDDVREKLSINEARWLPFPAWKLETSPGSEQWGYILDVPVTDRARIENLQDGLVSQGLSPDGTDPGMKGVTRYVRLPEGYNTKANKFLFGRPYKCTMLYWSPQNRTTLEALAKPFNIDLDAPRREQVLSGATTVADHPILGVEGLNFKEALSDGRFNVTCPWVLEHTDAIDDGAAVFTNQDGSIGFKCHHGNCQEKTARDLLMYLEDHNAGFTRELDMWRILRGFSVVPMPTAEYVPTPTISFLDDVVPSATATLHPETNDPLQEALGTLRRSELHSPESKEALTKVLYLAETLPTLDREQIHDEVQDAMGWSKAQYVRIMKGLRKEWYRGDKNRTAKELEFFDNTLFVKELNQFYDWKTRTFMTVEGFANANAHEDPEARKSALQDGKVAKVDRLDYVPGRERVFEEKGIVYGNMYYGDTQPEGIQGDASPWLNHFDAMGWGPYRKHILQFMAFTIRHPDVKINHMMIFGSREGAGKDFILSPLFHAMGEDARIVEGDALMEQYTGYLNGCKYLHINEAELGDRREAMAVANKLKPIAAAPPDKLRVREMFTKPFWVRNLVNGTMTTNSRTPLRLLESRRFFAIWSDLKVRDAAGDISPDWVAYWSSLWQWMESGGKDYCVWYLRNVVDLSDFNPGAPPPVTDFLKDIQEQSKPPLQRTIEEFIEYRYGTFACDLATVKDLQMTLRSGPLIAPESMYEDSERITIHRLTTALREMGLPNLRGRSPTSSARLWVIRNAARYEHLPPSDLHAQYLRQLEKVREDAKQKVVDFKR